MVIDPQFALIRNLNDAGCDAQITERILALHGKGRVEEELRLLQRHRRTLLHEVHKKQKHIDCLDFLTFTLRQSKTPTQYIKEKSMSTLVIAYFSYQGHTRQLAEQIQKAAGGTLFEIRPATAYSSDYDTCEAQAQKETREGYQPKLAENYKDMSSCNTIILGTPNWFNTVAPPVASFLASHDVSGKTIIPFCAHGGGGLGHVVRDMQKLAPGATVRDCLDAYEGTVGDASQRISAWLGKNSLNKE